MSQRGFYYSIRRGFQICHNLTYVVSISFGVLSAISILAGVREACKKLAVYDTYTYSKGKYSCFRLDELIFTLLNMSVMNTAQLPLVRLSSILSAPIIQRCEEIAYLVEEYGARELHSVFPALIESIFGIGGHIGWGLRTVIRSNQPREFEVLRNLLSPRGSIFALCYKLLTDPHLQYDFPLHCLPAAVKHCLEEGVIPSFYIDRVQYFPHSRTPASLSLNSFEYYIFHFVFHLINPVHNKVPTWNNGDTLYLTLVDDLLFYFLPCDSSVPALPYQSQMRTTVRVSSQPSFSTRSTGSPSLMRQSLLSSTSYTNSVGMNGHAGSYPTNTNETWRTQTVIHAVTEFWLNIGVSHTGKHSFLTHQEMFIPSLDHLRAVRLLIKRFHFFSNSASQQSITSLDDIKRTLIFSCQKQFYVFLRHSLEHWPLDASFRLFLETWLSYIQPWRYRGTQNRQSDSEDKDKAVDGVWQSFISENLLFYTVFFQRLVTRFLRLDLVSPKNAFMLFRLTKVFSQKNLRQMISSAENSLVESPSFSSTSRNLAQWSVIVRQHVVDLEGPGYNYIPMFGIEVTVMVKELLRSVAEAKLSIQASQENLAQETRKGFWSWFTSQSSVANDEVSAEDCQKALANLGIASRQIAELYNLELPQISLQEDGTPKKLTRMVQSPVLSSNFSPTVNPNYSLSPRLTPPTMPRRFDITFQGNPDTQPVRSYEITVLVRILHQLSTFFNQNYGTLMKYYYYRTDFLGRIAKQILQKPTTYSVVEKRQFGVSPRQKKYLPPRLSLRMLAHKQLVGYLIGLGMVFYACGWTVSGYLFLMFLLFTGFIVTRAFLEPSSLVYSEEAIQTDSATVFNPSEYVEKF